MFIFLFLGWSSTVGTYTGLRVRPEDHGLPRVPPEVDVGESGNRIVTRRRESTVGSSYTGVVVGRRWRRRRRGRVRPKGRRSGLRFSGPPATSDPRHDHGPLRLADPSSLRKRQVGRSLNVKIRPLRFDLLRHFHNARTCPRGHRRVSGRRTRVR